MVRDLRFLRPATYPDGLLLWTAGPTDGANPTSAASPPAPLTLVALPVDRAADPSQGMPLLSDHEVLAVSPDGERALFVHDAGGTDKALCEVPTNPAAGSGAAGAVECGGAPLATLLLSVRGGAVTGVAWSPDGQDLALSVLRSDHGFVAVWRRGDARLAWLSPGFDTDTLPTWSPDGSQLAFLRYRSTEDKNGVARAYQQGPAFSVFVADVGLESARSESSRDTRTARQRRFLGEAIPVREVFREWEFGYPGTGLNGYGTRPLLWAPSVGARGFGGGAAVLVGCEASGFTHVVAVDPGGDVGSGTASSVDLTPLECEHADWALGDGA